MFSVLGKICGNLFLERKISTSWEKHNKLSMWKCNCTTKGNEVEYRIGIGMRAQRHLLSTEPNYFPVLMGHDALLKRSATQ